jgi:hypothetical protein
MHVRGVTVATMKLKKRGDHAALNPENRVSRYGAGDRKCLDLSTIDETNISIT